MPPTRDQPRTAPPKWWAFILAGLCYSVFTALAFPPAGVWALSVFAPVPLVWAGCRASGRGIRGALLTALGVIPLWVYEQAWLWDVTRAGYPLIVLYLSAYAALFVFLFAAVRGVWLPRGRRSPLLPAFVVAPIVWTAIEVFRGEVALTGYPWYLAGHPLIEAPALAAPAALFGAYFVSFLLVALAGAIADAAGWMGGRRGLGGIGAACIVGLWAITGLIGRPDTPRGPNVAIALIQTDVPQDNKKAWTLEDRLRDWRDFVELTQDAAGGQPKPDLIVWPETMFPGEGLNAEYRDAVARILEARRQNPETTPATYFISRLLELQAEIGIPMVVGEEAVEGFRLDPTEDGKEKIAYDRRFNSAFIVERGRIRDERYDKIELTPFGEVIPYVWRWPKAQAFVERVGAGGMKFDLAAGKDLHVFTLDLSRDRRLTFVTPICFEATKSELCRRLVYEEGRRRASLIINLSNDGWFGSVSGWRGFFTGGRRQHLQAARWRCVELGVPMVRAVNTGISASIDHTGKIRQIGPDGRDPLVPVATAIVTSVHLAGEGSGTVFGRIGNAFGWAMLVLLALMPAAGAIVRRRTSNR